jgi:hypothetical protein
MTGVGRQNFCPAPKQNSPTIDATHPEFSGLSSSVTLNQGILIPQLTAVFQADLHSAEVRMATIVIGELFRELIVE